MSAKTAPKKERKPRQTAYKYRLSPTPEQAQALNQLLGNGRSFYNQLLAYLQKQYQAHIHSPSVAPKPNTTGYGPLYYIQAILSNPETPWLKGLSAVIAQQKALDLGNAYSNFFKKLSGHPRFKKKGYGDSVRVTGAGSIRYSQDGLLPPGFKEPIKIIWSRELPGRVTSYTLKRTSANEYYVAFVCEYVPTRQHGSGIIGIDLGIKTYAAISDGTAINNPKHYTDLQASLARLQRRLAKKKKGSNNYHSTRLMVARLHARIANMRKDFLHKLSSKLISENQAICIEDLNVAGMAKNHCLAKHVMTAGWAMFRQMLEYKTLEAGSLLLIADPFYPSTQLCSECGERPAVKLTLGIREWECQHCHTIHGRDLNAAKNLEKLALRAIKSFDSYIAENDSHIVRVGSKVALGVCMPPLAKAA